MIRRYCSALAVLAMGLGTVALASPVPDYHCAIEDHPDLARSGYRIGEWLYDYGNTLALQGYPVDESERLERRSDKEFSNGVVTVLIDETGARMSLNDGTVFICNKTAP